MVVADEARSQAAAKPRHGELVSKESISGWAWAGVQGKSLWKSLWKSRASRASRAECSGKVERSHAGRNYQAIRV